MSAIDSSHVSVEKEEFKHIIKVNIEKTNRDSILAAKTNTVNVLERIVVDKDSTISLLKSNFSILENSFENTKPSWWDHFIPGWITGIVTIILVVLIIK